MKRILITGGTGMIGGLILQRCLESKQVAQVISVVRRNTGMQHPKLVEVVHSDFMNMAAVADHFDKVDVAFYCIGVYTGQVPDKEFKDITFFYTQTFADILKKKSPGATVCFLSGAGADRTEKSRISFARYKGMAENYLVQKEFKYLYIFRPGYIYPVEKRKEPNFSYRAFRFLYPVLKVVYPAGVITSVQLADAMFKTGMEGTDKMILENTDIKNV